ncbi:MAG TPA: PQQ-dependent sugar dehydrogenase [Opitutus sp.]|nr:PQQ-dependent sugar dehydrogenase [Opitutus sp.]
MRLKISRSLLAAAVALPGATAAAENATVARDVTAVYAEFCSGCHGAQMEGGKAGSLIDESWKHGGDDRSLRRSIRQGYPESGMPAFATALTESEIGALTNYIHELATRRREPIPQQELPLPRAVLQSEEHAFWIENVAEGFDVPWSFAFLPDGRMLVTERVGRLRVIEHGQLRPDAVEGIPRALVRDEAGLMSVVAHPDFAKNGWIYLSFSDPGPGDTAMTKVVRGRIRDGRWVDEQVVFAMPPECYQPSSVLFGGRLVFQGDYLFISVGERGMEEGTTGQAQDPTVPNGKIHRVFHDGRVPPDNPYADIPGWCASIWALGVRNPQGLAVNPADGGLWETEHGPRGGDELNRIERGRNYGWPVITRGMRYDGRPLSDRTEAPGMEQPVIDWTPSIAVSQIEFYRGDRFPRWKGNLFVGSLAQQKFLRVVVAGGRVVHREEVFNKLGRIRDIKTGPDGLIYLALELIGKPGRIVRLVPTDDQAATSR